MLFDESVLRNRSRTVLTGPPWWLSQGRDETRSLVGSRYAPLLTCGLLCTAPALIRLCGMVHKSAALQHVYFDLCLDLMMRGRW